VSQSKDKELDAELVSADQLIVAAREYFSSEFPNPHREGCPAPGVITRIAASGTLPTDDLRAHLFSCSECFTEFSETLAASAPAVSSRQPWWGFITSGGKPAFAVVTVLMLLTAVLFLIFVLRERPESPQQVTSNGKATTKPSPEVVEANKSTESTPPSEITGERLTKNLVAARLNVDLEDYPVLRDAAGEGLKIKPIQLVATLTEIILRLPEGSPSSPFMVSIKNTKLDRTYLSSRAQVPNSRTRILKARLDLRKLEPGRYVLCVSPASEVPFCYQASVAAASK